MSKPSASIWTVPPQPAIPDLPALLSDSDTLWLAYAVGPIRKRFAVVRFLEVIDHHLSSINDEGIQEHPYANAGLELYSFNELAGSAEIEQWAALHPRHWVITFKDNTLDVLAEGAEVINDAIEAKNSLAALLSVVSKPTAQQSAPGDAPKPARP